MSAVCIVTQENDHRWSVSSGLRFGRTWMFLHRSVTIVLRSQYGVQAVGEALEDRKDETQALVSVWGKPK